MIIQKETLMQLINGKWMMAGNGITWNNNFHFYNPLSLSLTKWKMTFTNFPIHPTIFLNDDTHSMGLFSQQPSPDGETTKLSSFYP
jgi:hypothetical protein